MSGILALVLRLILAMALYGFLGFALLLLWRETQKQGHLLTNRRVPAIDLLVQRSGEAPMNKHFTQPEITIGRDPGSDIPLIEDTISTRHAQLTYHHAQWWLEDLASTNGTSLNEAPIDMPTVITSGDEIICGSTLITVGLSTDIVVETIQ